MNLAVRDVAYYRLKFFSSTIGVSLLIMVVVAIGGIIRGIISDSSTIIENTGADLWVVQAKGAHPQEGTLGPFVEISRIPQSVYHAIESMSGVAEASPLVTALPRAWTFARACARHGVLVVGEEMKGLVNAKYGRIAPLVDRERGIYDASDNIAVLYESRMPALLLEAGMIVNRAEEQVLSSATHRATVARAVATAAERFCGVRAPQT